MITNKCNKCGKEFKYTDVKYVVTCKHITFFENDTKRYLCGKCYKKFQKYMEKSYNEFFSFLTKAESEVDNEVSNWYTWRDVLCAS